MLDFNTFIARHGEVAAQAIVENIERHEGARKCMSGLPLETRWKLLMRADEDLRCAA